MPTCFSMDESDLDAYSEFLTTLSFPKLISFLLEQFARDDIEDDLLDETFDYFLYIGSGGFIESFSYS